MFNRSIFSCFLLGSPVTYTGMTWSAFRPSDDEQKFGYLVPSNMFAVVALRFAEELATGTVAQSFQCITIQAQIQRDWPLLDAVKRRNG